MRGRNRREGTDPGKEAQGLDGGKGSSLRGKPRGEGAKGRLLWEEGGSGTSREKA